MTLENPASWVDDYDAEHGIAGDFSLANWDALNDGPTIAEATEHMRWHPTNADGSVTLKVAPFEPREYDILALQDKINEDIRRLAALTPYRHTVLHNRVFVEGYIPQELPLCDRPIPAEGQE